MCLSPGPSLPWPQQSQAIPRAKGLSPRYHPEGLRQDQELSRHFLHGFLPQAKATNEPGKPMPWAWGGGSPTLSKRQCCRGQRQTNLPA